MRFKSFLTSIHRQQRNLTPPWILLIVFSDHVELVKRTMAAINLPTLGIPTWAQDISDDQWKDMVQQTLQSRQSSAGLRLERKWWNRFKIITHYKTCCINVKKSVWHAVTLKTLNQPVCPIRFQSHKQLHRNMDWHLRFKKKTQKQPCL